MTPYDFYYKPILILSWLQYVHRNLPTRIFDPTDLWRGFPHTPLAAPLKLYYLTQTAFYIHQVLILNAEARRKDHVQMMTHHAITIFLMTTSYHFNFTRVGCLIMVLMDWCDIFLPVRLLPPIFPFPVAHVGILSWQKMMRYLEISQIACDVTFAWFLVSWFVTRHVLFIFAIISVIVDFPKIVPLGRSVEDGASKSIWFVSCVMLLALQVCRFCMRGCLMLTLDIDPPNDLVWDDLSDCLASNHHRQRSIR